MTGKCGRNPELLRDRRFAHDFGMLQAWTGIHHQLLQQAQKQLKMRGNIVVPAQCYSLLDLPGEASRESTLQTRVSAPLGVNLEEQWRDGAELLEPLSISTQCCFPGRKAVTPGLHWAQEQ